MALPSDFNSRCSISDNSLDRDLVDLAPLDSVPFPQPSAECDGLDPADDAESSGVDFTHQSNQAPLPFTSCEPERSTFLKSSVSDIPLTSLEELLARSSINDVYIGPVKGDDGKLLPLDPNRRTLTDPSSLPYSSSSLAFAPPGIIMVSEIWSMFVTERLSYCNHRIHGLNVNALRTCLYDHGLNQLGCPAVLRRRLQEFVRRVRYAMSNVSGCLDSQDVLGPNHTESFETHEPNETLITSQPISSDVVSDIPSSPCSLSSSGSAFPPPIKLAKPIILTPDTFYSYLLIIDLEATCDVQTRSKTVPEYPHEIIEFPVLLYNTRTRRCVGVFHSYCRPKLNPDLTTFCTNLTQISQVQVDTACSFPQVLTKIENWLFTQHHLSNVRCAIVCDCSADMGKFMRIQCRLDGIPLPSWAKVWINLSKAFRLFYKLPSRHPVTLSTMLHDLNLSFIGQQHRGLDDAINILRVVRTLLADGCVLRVNERVDSGRAPTFVTSVPRLVAETTSGLMGSRLLLLSQKSRGGVEKEDVTSQTCLPVNIPEDHRQSLLWLANVQKSRLPNNY
ncbi:3'-5' exoribonuclease 1 [Paragonimus westermani]|uniref:3'-5' exoribonuclease 1 n=1 Tax=Paragonimus westermani TaxID=34504 RepID=A0A5J4N786_9TREM|nr:3'-5' exoribonuclease 1 [Paragonimus westermani]